MKKLLSIILVCATMLSILAMMPMSVGALTIGTPGNLSSATRLNATYGTPELDGEIDSVWETTESITLENVVRKDSKFPDAAVKDECDVSYKVLWDEDLVYILVVVKDDELSPDYYTPPTTTDKYDKTTGTDSRWWRTDCLFMFVSENGNATGFGGGNSYQLALPLTEDYYETGIVRRGEKEIGHPIKDGALKRKTVIDGNTAILEMSLDLREELVGETNHSGMSMGLGFGYFDVDASSDNAQAALNDNYSTNPRTLTITSYNEQTADNSKNFENFPGRNNFNAIKFTEKRSVLKGTPEIDGEIDDIWTSVTGDTLDYIVTINGAGNESTHPEKNNSAIITAKHMYDDEKIYMMFEIKDDDYCTGITDKEWKNDSLYIKLGLQQGWYSEHSSNNPHKEITYATQNTYGIYLQPSDSTNEGAFKGAYVRNGQGNPLNMDFKYTITGDDSVGYTIVMELAITAPEFFSLEAGNAYYVDYQYNDANPTYDASNNNRDLVRNWMSGDLGLGNSNVLGKMVLSDEMAYVTANDAALKYYTASLGDKIGMNYYMQLSKEVAEDPATKMNFEVAGVQQSPVSIADAVKVNKGGTDYYVFTCNVAAKQMTDVIKAQLETTGGTTKTYSYTVAQYANYIIGHTDDYAAKEIELAQALLNYGAEAQLRFNYNTENLATADPTFEEVPDEIRSYVKTTDGTVAGVDSVGTKAVLESAMALRYYFAFAGATEGYTFKYGNTVLELKEDDDGCYVEVPKIVAKHYDETYTVTVTKNGDTMTVTTSVYAYIADILADADTYADSQEVAKALYWYNVAANNYFG